MTIGENEVLLSASHFERLPGNTFGVPFLVKITDGETVGDIKLRVQKMLNVPDKDFEKFKFSLVGYEDLRSMTPLSIFHKVDNDDELLSLDFIKKKALDVFHWPFIAIEHVNSDRKASYMDKSIVIHN